MTAESLLVTSTSAAAALVTRVLVDHLGLPVTKNKGNMSPNLQLKLTICHFPFTIYLLTRIRRFRTL